MATEGIGGHPAWWVPLNPREERLMRRNLVREEQERKLLKEQGVDISDTEDIEGGDNTLLRGTIYDEEEMQIEEQSFEDYEELRLRISGSDTEASGEEQEENDRRMRHNTKGDDRNVENSLLKEVEERTEKLVEKRRQLDELSIDIERRQQMTERRNLELVQKREAFERRLKEDEEKIRRQMQRELQKQMYTESITLLQQMEGDITQKHRLPKLKQKEIAQKELELQQAEERWEEEKQAMERSYREKIRIEFERQRDKLESSSGGARPKALKQEKLVLPEQRVDLNIPMKETSRANRNEDREHKGRHKTYTDLPDRERRYEFPNKREQVCYSEFKKSQSSITGKEMPIRGVTVQKNNSREQVERRVADIGQQKEREKALSLNVEQEAESRKKFETKTDHLCHKEEREKRAGVSSSENKVPETTPVQ